MKRKLLMLALCLTLIAAIAMGCNNNEEAANNATNRNNEINNLEETNLNESTEEMTEIVMLEDATRVFVTPEYVKQVIDGEMAGSDNYVIIEAGWGPADVSATYQATHLPGAVHMNTDDIESPEYWNIRSADEITEVMAKYGITKDTLLIVYGGDSGAARVAFVALWAGVENVKLIDGGLNAWLAADYPTEAGILEPTATTEAFGMTIPAHPEYVIPMPVDAQAELDDNDNFRLVSIRTLDEFLGKTSGYSYIERAGEPAGALWGHDEFDYLNEDGTFVDIATAEALWNEQNINKGNDIAFYCGTGWRATIPFLIAYENNWENIQLFDGGWFAWQMDENNPVQSISPEDAVSNLK